MYCAPEQLMGTSCSLKSDIYALGTVLWELCTGLRPNRNLRPIQVPQEAPAGLVEMISRCHQIAPEDRPSAVELYSAWHCAEMVR